MCRYLLLFIVMASFYIPSAASASKSSPIRSYSNVVTKSNPYTSQAWLGSLIGGGLSLIGGLFGNKSQSKNIDKQIQAQQEENKKNRDYNLMLAQLQNQWNQDQWERENDYNTPEAQMERLKKAGLNPDLMMSQGAHNLAASSPMMTSGAPSQSVDMTTLGQKPTLGQAIQIALRDSMIGAQIDNIKANTRKTNAEAGLTEIDERAMKAIELIRGSSLDSAEIPKDWQNNPYISAKLAEFEKAVSDAKTAAHDSNIRGYDEFIRDIEKKFKEKEVSHQVGILANQLKISEKEAEYLTKTLAARIHGLTLENKIKDYEAVLNSPELIKELPDGLKPLISLVNLVVRGH